MRGQCWEGARSILPGRLYSPRQSWSSLISVLRYQGTVIEQAQGRINLSSLAVQGAPGPIGGTVGGQAAALQEAVLCCGRAAPRMDRPDSKLPVSGGL